MLSGARPALSTDHSEDPNHVFFTHFDQLILALSAFAIEIFLYVELVTETPTPPLEQFTEGRDQFYSQSLTFYKAQGRPLLSGSPSPAKLCQHMTYVG